MTFKFLSKLEGEDFITELNNRTVTLTINPYHKDTMWLVARDTCGNSEHMPIEMDKVREMKQYIDKMSDSYKQQFIDVCEGLGL